MSPLELPLLKPVTLYVPLPFANDKDSRFPVLKYDPATATWSYTGKDLVVDGSRTGGVVELSQGGIYSVAGQGTYTEEKISESFLYDFSCQANSPIHLAGRNRTPRRSAANHLSYLAEEYRFTQYNYRRPCQFPA